MCWQGIRGHTEVVEQFRRALTRSRLASSFLFVGPEGIGKRSFALRLAQSMLCQTRPEVALDPCGKCQGCVQVLAQTHPDLQLVAKPKDRAFIPLETFIGDKEHRMREGLCRGIALKPFMGGRKIALVDDADFLNPEGANALLKTLEEPPPRSVLILIGTTPAKQLPTIRSRCQLVRFRSLPEPVVAQILLETKLVDDAAEADRLAARSAGSIRQALDLADPELWTFRSELFERLADSPLESVALAKTLLAFVDAAGREAAVRRRRMRRVVGFAAEFYRQLLHRLGGVPESPEAQCTRSLARAIDGWHGDLASAAACLDRSIEALEQIDRNANPATLLESWLDDLGRHAGC